ncbi:MAG TPA: histidine kinase [Gammaproteobacteria bacterium]|nr:histidine kinase [Gammaproteobacteria bacterium]
MRSVSAFAIVAAMSTPTASLSKLARVFGWRRVRVALGAALLVSLLLLPGWETPYWSLLGRLLFIGLVLLLVFDLFERWPARLPRWLARWALQVAAVALAVPAATWMAYTLVTIGNRVPWWTDAAYLTGFGTITALSLIVSPWVAVAALLRQIKDEARNQALAFELERSKYERNALDARLKLLQAQVEPHFLFNTLANVRELVDAGSPQASSVLNNLIAYLRAAVPRMHDSAPTLQQEFELVRAYLEVMQMRMPDRLQFTLYADDEALPLFCPPMSLLTLVENAVRHGIDPSEAGGRIEVRVGVRDGRCHGEVIDTGLGLTQVNAGSGIGLSNVRERLALAFGGDAQLRVSPLEPHGACASIEFPARSSST